MSKKEPLLIEKYKAIQTVGPTKKVPWKLKRFLPDGGEMEFTVWGTQISMGGDFLELEEAREAASILAAELGGTIKWDK